MKKFTILLIIILFLFQNHSYSQYHYRTSTDTKQAVYNIGLGAISSGIGAMINKKPDEKLGKVFVKGFWQGALGGYVTFESKRILRAAERNESWELIWAAKLVNAAGASFKENAAANRDFWEKLNIEIGFNRVEFDTKNRFRVSYRVMPAALLNTVFVVAMRKTKFDLKRSAQTGEFIFVNHNEKFWERIDAAGFAGSGSIVLNAKYLDNDYDSFRITVHEIVHVYQGRDFANFEPYLNKPLQKLNEKSEFWNKINRYVHYDLRFIPFDFSHGIIEGARHADPNYYDNFFEFEAGYWSNGLKPYYEGRLGIPVNIK